jgi:hypothetical protein
MTGLVASRSWNCRTSHRREVTVQVLTLDPIWLLVSLIPGGIGFVLLVYGKKQQRWPYLVAGLLFIVYPYFTPTLVSLVATGAALGLLLWYAVHFGW